MAVELRSKTPVDHEPEYALQLAGVTKTFSGFFALKDVSLTVRPGEIQAIIGPNGAGKSTLFASVAAEIAVDGGSVAILGHATSKKDPSSLVQLGLSRAFQVARIYPSMTVFENIMIAVLGIERLRPTSLGRRVGTFFAPRRLLSARVVQAATETGLEDVLSYRAGAISHGDKKRLELAMALCMEPKVLLLDEPTAGMSPEETESTVALLKKLHNDRRLTMLITEHDLSVVYALSDRIAVLNRGAIIANGLPDEIRRNSEVARVYMGGGGVKS
ncbi:ABC transporter ATP-binding protein [Georgenia ruanii]|uniref:ATP-binding cassette domain-containing protein n=1 Tax=Georgenia ruanii TaxID=348442 RepID=A0A7J9USP3_9MICO|nr:ABC transporter ATP-binding protein [Georgenia ruanii]MPV87635.1 ATP-binding cassette domain-containing protein [Georgenia ruanii]